MLLAGLQIHGEAPRATLSGKQDVALSLGVGGDPADFLHLESSLTLQIPKGAIDRCRHSG